MKMKAARLYGKKDLRVENIPVPQILEDEILLRVKAAAICGTDLRMYQNGLSGIDEEHPVVLAHEFAGIIEQVGSRVSGYTQGQRVCVAPNISCGLCEYCTSGKEHHCHSLLALGIHMDGGFGEFVRIPAAAVRLGNVVPLEESVSYKAAAANEALSCVYSSAERYHVRPGDTVVVVGAGAIGLMHARCAMMAGAAKVILSDISETRLDFCKSLEKRVHTISGNPVDFVLRETDGAGADVVITACSAAPAQQNAFSLAALDARVNFFGGLPAGKEYVELNTNLIHYKQLTVTGTTRSSLRQYRKTLQFIAKGLLCIDDLVTHTYKIEDIEEAFENAEKAIGLKQVILF